VELEPALFQENERLARATDERRYVEIGELAFERGGSIASVTVAYECWGELSKSKDNAVLICHALTGDSHAVGWWDRIVGPGKPVDTEKLFVICTNCLGGCQGTTGPSSPAPDGSTYGSRFPEITLGDTVEAMRRALRGIGVERLYAAAGGSMGGMQILEWTVRYPGEIEKAWITAACAAHSAMQIGFNEAQRQAVLRDPKWRGGDYPADDPPANGLSVSRMIAHLLFLSEASLAQKFGRGRQDRAPENAATDVPSTWHPRQFQVESYLNYQGDKFTKRFDAGSFVCLTKAMNAWECASLGGSTTEYLFTSFASDWLYPPHQSEQLHEMALAAGCESRWVNVELPYGHDAFLLDAEHQGRAVREFLGT